MKKNLQTEHDFSLTSGQIVGLIAGQVVIVLLAFVAGLLVGRYDMARELVTLARQSSEQAPTAVPLVSPTALGMRTQKPAAKTTAALPGKPLAAKSPAKPAPPAKPGPASAKPQAKPAEPKEIQIAAAKKPEPAKPEPAPAKKQPAKPIPTPAPARKPAVTAKDTYSVQVFWSRGQQKTADYVKKLEQSGFDAWVKPPGTGEIGYRAMIGRYPTYSEAAKVLKELRQKKEFSDAWIPPAG